MVDVEADVADMVSIKVSCSICGEMECWVEVCLWFLLLMDEILYHLEWLKNIETQN